MDPQGSQTLEPSTRGSREEEKRCAWKVPLLNSVPVCSGHSTCAAQDGRYSRRSTSARKQFAQVPRDTFFEARLAPVLCR
jgi:hypothetical protein